MLLHVLKLGMSGTITLEVLFFQRPAKPCQSPVEVPRALSRSEPNSLVFTPPDTLHAKMCMWHKIKVDSASIYNAGHGRCDVQHQQLIVACGRLSLMSCVYHTLRHWWSREGSQENLCWEGSAPPDPSNWSATFAVSEGQCLGSC